MRKSNRNHALMIVIFVLLLLIGGVLSLTWSAGRIQAIQSLSRSEGIKDSEVDRLLTAIVVIRAASGASYMADRDHIVTMPLLETEQEIRAFVARYEPTEADMRAVRMYLEEMGFSAVAQDNLFLIVSGTHWRFEELLRSPAMRSRIAKLQLWEGPLVVRSEELQVDRSSPLHLLDGMIIYPPMDAVSSPVHKRTDSEVAARPGCPSLVDDCELGWSIIDDVAFLMDAELVHQKMGVTGAGVRIGFVDSGVNLAHPFFGSHPVEAWLFRWVDGNILPRVGNNFELGKHSGHGTMVASFLAAFAPDARLLSFARPTEETTELWDVTYLSYMHQHNLVDVVSLSIGDVEEDVDQEQYLPELRTQMVNLISDGVIILVAAGNANQEGKSGHNASAAIPEVIAVGGADLDFTAAGGYDDLGEGCPTGAASFTSTIFLGRHVPDFVGVYGPRKDPPGSDLCFPGFPEDAQNSSTYMHGPCGTSCATPQVAGIVALLKQRYPSLNQTQVRGILENASLDITMGQSGDGQDAGPGYDDATGYGAPMATWAMTERVPLNKGWNLIGLSKEHSGDYSAVDLLNEINDQGGYSCDNVTRWIPSQSKYEGVVVDEEGNVYGFDFDLELGIAYWLRCLDRVLWQPSGTDYVDAPQTIHISPGLNFFSIPYSEAPCTVEDILYISGANCFRVLQYNGQFQETQELLTRYGRNYVLSPGHGYIAICVNDADWTPICGEGRTSLTLMSPDNLYTPNLRARDHLADLIAVSRQPNIDSALCTPQNVRFSNISDQQFGVSWTTEEPCMASVIIHTGDNPTFRAYDDRGLRFAGTTHHVTIRELDANTTYSFGLLSGDVWDDNNGDFYQVRTGEALNLPSSTYDVHGFVVDQVGATVQDGVIYAQLQNRDTSPIVHSTLLSYPLDEFAGSYVITLDNARTDDADAYFDYAAATHLSLDAQGGSMGQSTTLMSVDLETTPSITATTLTLNDIAPVKPTWTEPSGPVLALLPTFRFSTTDTSGHALTYRVDISLDNFATVEQSYDQRVSTVGWSAASYVSGEVAHFTIPNPLQAMRAYQWRIFAHNGAAWSVPSEIVTFSMARYSTAYLPVIFNNADGSQPPGPTPTPAVAPTPRPTATHEPVIPPPDAGAPCVTIYSASMTSGEVGSGWRVPSCAGDFYSAQFYTVPGLSFTFDTSDNAILEISFGGLGRSSANYGGIFSGVFVDGQEIMNAFGHEQLGGCRNDGSSSADWTWCDMANIAAKSVEAGSHTVEIRVKCDLNAEGRIWNGWAIVKAHSQ